MGDVMGILNLVETNQALNEITLHRPLATVPFGGRYRLIDFVLSGMVNSGVSNVGILTPYQQRSLLDHLRSGKDWQLLSKKDGLVLLPPSYTQPGQFLESDVHNLHGNLEFLKRSRQEYAIVSAANLVGNFDYRQPLQFHREMGADITVLCQRQQPAEQDCPYCSLVDAAEDGRVKAIHINPTTINLSKFLLGTFILRRSLLIKLVQECAGSGIVSLLQGIAARLDRLKVFAYDCPDYIARIHCLSSYYRYNLELLKPEVWQAVFAQPQEIYTKIRDEAPVRYGSAAKVTNAIVGGSCQLHGTVENSVLFQRVTVGKGAYVAGSVLLPNTKIEANAELINVICDKDVVVTAGKSLQGEPGKPLVLRKGTVV